MTCQEGLWCWREVRQGGELVLGHGGGDGEAPHLPGPGVPRGARQVVGGPCKVPGGPGEVVWGPGEMAGGPREPPGGRGEGGVDGAAPQAGPGVGALGLGLAPLAPLLAVRDGGDGLAVLLVAQLLLLHPAPVLLLHLARNPAFVLI